MSKRDSVDYSAKRKEVANLFIAVLTKRVVVRDALANFPKDCPDKSIIAAWHALCHLEADEDLRIKDAMYRQEQDEYIEFIAFTLQKGEELPSNIINSYLPYHSEALIPAGKGIKAIINKLKRFLCC